MEIHIGSVIKKVVAEKKLSAGYLADKIDMAKSSVNRLYSYKSMQTELLIAISVALDYDFFAVYSGGLNIKKEEVKVVSECEKMLEVKSAELETVKIEMTKEVEALQKEMAYVKEINELLRRKK